MLVWPLAIKAFIALVTAGLLLVIPWFKVAKWLNDANPTLSLLKLTKLRKFTDDDFAFWSLVFAPSCWFMLPDLSMTSITSIGFMHGCSSLQLESQPSPFTLLPSSQNSSACFTLSPQNSFSHAELQQCKRRW